MTTNEKSTTDIISTLSFCVFDLETTGGNHNSDKIIEIGMVKIQNLELVEKKEYLINPEIKIPDFIQKLTSITPKDIKNSPKIEEVIDDIVEFMGDSILVAHNTSFDIPFFNSVLKRLQMPLLKNKSICTNLMTKYLIPNLLNSNLNYMSKVFGISHVKAHRALDDAEAAAKLLLKYLQIFIEKDIKKINHLYYPRNRYELDRANFKKETPIEEIIENLKKLKTPYLFTLKGDNGIIQFCYPAAQTEKELEYFKESLNKHDWTNCTILLYGTFLEALIAFNSFFAKLDASVKTEILKFLWKEYFPNKKALSSTPNGEENNTGDIGQKVFEDELGDYIIMNHLVPEQYIIFPIASMHKKSELIFRYPSHRKKLIQYINSKNARLSAGKLKKIFFYPSLKDFISEYIKSKPSQNKDFLLIEKELSMKGPDALLKGFEAFSAKNPNSNSYPKEYI